MAFKIKNGVLKEYMSEMYESEAVVPEGVTAIGKCAFAGSCGLKSVMLPKSVMMIGESAFYGCSGLTSIMIPEGVANIGHAAFSDCSSLTSMTIPESVTSIGNFAFAGCENLTSMTISEGVISIGYWAFYGCKSLASMTIPEGVTKIGYNAFDGCRSIRLFGITFASNEFRERDYAKARIMLQTKDFSVKLSTDIKYAAAVGFWMKTEDEAAEAFIRKNISRIMTFLIEYDNTDAIGKMLESGKFITKKNIDKFIECAIAHTQNGGSPEIQTMLMHYKSETIGYRDPAAQFKL